MCETQLSSDALFPVCVIKESNMKYDIEEIDAVCSS